MSLRTKMMVSIFVFMLLVAGLLTLNLWLDAAARARAEAQRNADLMARVVGDLARAWTSRFPDWTAEAWAEIDRRLSHTELVQRWTIVGYSDGHPLVMSSNEEDPERAVRDDAEAFAAALLSVRVEDGGTRVYVPIETAQGGRFAARLDLRGPAAPADQIAGTVRGIATVMALGTALLLLNVVVVTSRLVLRPLERLAEASSRVARGDYSQRVAEEGAYDEMGRLIRAFNGMQEQIALHRRSLEGEVVRAHGKVSETQRALSAAQRLSTAGTLAAGVAHEINNPLGGMLNAVRSLREGKLDEAKRAEYLGLVADGLERIRAIVQRMLQFGPRTIEPRPVVLRDAVVAAAAFLGHRTQAKEVEIRNELPQGLPLVDGDPLELQQAFLNVLLNAVDACVMGEGVVTVYGRAEGGRITVSVADNGCGMDEEERTRCLDPFFTTKDPGEGTGLGLAVAHNIAANHGGTLRIDSERGKGTTVTFTFPPARAGLAAAGGQAQGS